MNNQSNSILVKTRKSRFIYILLAVSGLGLIGVHNLYAGRYKQAKIQMLLWPLTLASSAIGLLSQTIGACIFGLGIAIIIFWPIRDITTVKTDGDGDPMS